MHIARPLLLLSASREVLSAAITGYTLKTNCLPVNFYDCFDFYSTSTATEYLNLTTSSTHHLITRTQTYVNLTADATTTLVPNTARPGRQSIRLESRRTYTRALYLISLHHLPTGCGVWPAFWSFGPDWPRSGEIDVIESVNGAGRNLMSLHTGADCSIAGQGQTGTLMTKNCDVGYSTTGCGTESRDSLNAAGAGFNRNGGGWYAMEWTSAAIKMWFFPRAGGLPSGLTVGRPVPAEFGTPLASFAGDCNVDKHFRGHKIVLDTTFCGDYAGNVYGSPSCPTVPGKSSMESCVDFVARNPAAFREAYWSVEYLKVYQEGPSVS